MRAVVQRVSSASVSVDGRVVSEIGKGLLVYVGVEKGDAEADVGYIASKVAGLRVFEDAGGKMNLNLAEAKGKAMVVSQFTLHGDCRKGTRPSFGMAEAPQRARQLYEALAGQLGAWLPVATGQFQAHMEVSSTNDGPVTVLLDSRRLF